MGEGMADHPSQFIYSMLSEEILTNLDPLMLNEAGARLVQALLRVAGVGDLVRVICWICANIDAVVKNKPSVFTALVVLELSKKFEAKMERDVIFDLIVEKLLNMDQSTGLPLIILASTNQAGHMLVIDVLT